MLQCYMVNKALLPMHYGHPTVWSTDGQIKNTLQEVGISFSKSTIKRRLHQSKYRRFTTRCKPLWASKGPSFHGRWAFYILWSDQQPQIALRFLQKLITFTFLAIGHCFSPVSPSSLDTTASQDAVATSKWVGGPEFTPQHLIWCESDLRCFFNHEAQRL